MKFAVFDIDGTIFRWQLYHELFDAFVDEQIIATSTARTVIEAREAWRQRKQSYDAYEHALIDAMEKVIEGLDTQRFDAIADKILRAKGHHTYQYTLRLLGQLRQEGYKVITISGSHQQLVDRFSKLHHIDIAVGRRYEIEDGKLTARAETVFGNKHTILQSLVRQHKLDWKDSYAIGDSGGDISMLELVDHPIAFNPNEELHQKAEENGWTIVIERKNIAYRLEKGSDGLYVLAQTDTF